MRNVVIIGGGIAGHTAAVYTARANLSPLVLLGQQPGGQLTLTSEVENFPGFEHGIDGTQLSLNAQKQAERFGAEYKQAYVKGVSEIEGGYEIELDSDEKVQSKTIIVATGASARWLDIESEQAYKGKGVTACATCDGFFFRDKEVIVVGGGDSAMEEALFLTKFCSKVTIIHRRDEFRASKIMADRALAHEKIAVEWNSTVVEVLGNGTEVTGVKLKDTKTGDIRDFSCDGVFMAIGHTPNTTMFKDLVELDENGYIKTDRFMHTNKPGVFAAGDVQDTRYRQAITAAGSGCQCAIEAERYLAENE